jgi:hypothetical protein
MLIYTNYELLIVSNKNMYVEKETHNVVFIKKKYSLYFKLFFYSNALLYWANMSYTNLKQDSEQRLNKQKVKNDKLSKFSVTLTYRVLLKNGN